MKPSSSVAAVVAVLCTLAGVLGVTCAPALAAKIYFPGVSFGWHVNRTAVEEGRVSEENVCPAPGHLADRCQPGEGGSNAGQLSGPVGVAVSDESGDVYVVDQGNRRVEEFTETGVFVAEFAPPGGFGDPYGVAVDNSESLLDLSRGDVYVTDIGRKVIDKFSAVGAYEGDLTEAEVCKYEEPCQVRPFASLRGIATDSAGDLWVFQVNEAREAREAREEGLIDEFSDAGSFAETFRLLTNPRSNHALAVGCAGEVYVGEGVVMDIDNYTTSGGLIAGTEGHPGTGALAVVPCAAGALAGEVLQDTGDAIARYEPITSSGQAPLEVFPGEDVPAGHEGLSASPDIAVNASATVYASEPTSNRIQSFDYVEVPTATTEAPVEVTETGLTLHGSVNPEGESVSECYFEYGVEPGKYTNTVECEPKAGEITGSKAVAVSAKLSGLPAAQLRSFRLVAVSSAGVPGDGKGVAIARPVTAREAISGVGAVAARASGEINPGNLPSCYWIEYGLSAEYGSKTPEVCVGAGEAEVAVGAELVGLQPDSSYHFRVVARNELGVLAGSDFAFSTFSPSVASLPDGRVYEVVSAVGAGHDTDVYVPNGMLLALDTVGGVGRHGIYTGFPFQASEDGEAVAYVGDPPANGGNGAFGDSQGNEYVARRGSLGGWSQESINASSFSNSYLAFSGDLSVGVLESAEQLAESAPAGYHNLYRRTVGWRPSAGGAFEAALGSFKPLFSTGPCDLPAEFGALINNKHEPGPLFDGGNEGTASAPAFSHVLFEADASLPSIPAAEGCQGGNDLYDSVGGSLHLVNVLPDGKVESDATFGRQGPSANGFLTPEISNVISSDGSRIYWSAVETVALGSQYEERPKALYVRENDTQPQSPVEGGECTVAADACTVQVDRAEPGMGPSGHGQFWTASRDGASVFFTDESRLTKGAGAAAGAADLYEYDLERPEEERLVDLTAPLSSGAHAAVQGVVGVSEDGSYVYFVADGVMTEGKNAEEREPVEGQPNLYVRHDGVTTFVATLSSEDDAFKEGTGAMDGDWQADPGKRTAEVTPDGQSVTFMSRLPLTGYENKLDGVPLTEVFVYDLATGRIACASCNPSGEAPVAPALPEYDEHISEIWGSFLPVSKSLGDYQPHLISADGSRVFFDSIEPLVPRDDNGYLDVYEWERHGSGTCSEPRGCIYLLSGGQDDENSYLADASSNGDDVFFVSRAQLAKQDPGGEDDVLYDARVGGIEAPAEETCTGTSCQGLPPAPPIFATPASATFAGTGNFPPPALEVESKGHKKPRRCARGRRMRHGRCVKARGVGGKHGAKAKKSSARAENHRRGK
jgi:hypothetical protein